MNLMGESELLLLRVIGEQMIHFSGVLSSGDWGDDPRLRLPPICTAWAKEYCAPVLGVLRAVAPLAIRPFTSVVPQPESVPS